MDGVKRADSRMPHFARVVAKHVKKCIVSTEGVSEETLGFCVWCWSQTTNKNAHSPINVGEKRKHKLQKTLSCCYFF